MDDFRDVYEKYFNNIWHICLAYMKNTSEAEDCFAGNVFKIHKIL